MGIIGKNPERFIEAMKRARIVRARKDPAYFCEYILTDEVTGRNIRNASFHNEWHDFLSSVKKGVIIASIEHGKSYQIGVGRMLWEMGNDPNIRILLLGQSDTQSEKILGHIKQEIDNNRRIKEVFPNLKRATKGYRPWTKQEMVIERTVSSRDPTIQARSINSKSILGSRLDLVCIDDILDLDNTKTSYRRNQMEAFLDIVVFTRLQDDYETGKFARVFVIGTPFDQDDILHRLGAREGWELRRYPCVENPSDSPKSWVPIWPNKWPLERIYERRNETSAPAFARAYLCQVLDDSMRRFRWEWLQHMLEQGKRRGFLKRQPTGRNGELLRCFTGVDPAAGDKEENAESCLFTIAIDHLSRRIVADIRTGQWTGPELLDQMEEVFEIVGSEFLVEKNGVQRWMAQFGRKIGITARSVNTGSDKWSEEYGVESLAVEMRSGMWVAPSGETGNEAPKEVMEWINECYDFDPSKHTGDRLMASWIALKGAREYGRERYAKSNHMLR